jgi:hypothetical protein
LFIAALFFSGNRHLFLRTDLDMKQVKRVSIPAKVSRALSVCGLRR